MSENVQMPQNIDRNRLLIKGFPSDFQKIEIQQFLQLFGACEVIVRGRNTAYARFDTIQLAKDALKFLHQHPLKEKLLSVEYAKINTPSQISDEIDETNSLNISSTQFNDDNNKILSGFVQRLTATNEHLNFHQPPPPHLKYLYPKQNRDILDSICIALESSTKFYTQVLHLMNRMNMDPPFVPGAKSLVYPKLYSSIGTQTDGSSVQISSVFSNDLASDESELESDNNVIPINVKKRKRSDIIKAIPVDTKKKFRSIIASGAKSKAITITGDKSTNKIIDVLDAFEMNKKSSLDRGIKIVAPTTLLDQQGNHKTTVSPITEITTSINNDCNLSETKIISNENLSSNQIPINQLSTHPLFQNYQPGKPSNKLYIKNLAKTVVDNDLRQIYQRYSKSNQTDDIDIRLMQSGRMKGQAFITFKNPYLDDEKYELVERALRETNGYILKDKVMVVMFGKM